MNSPTTEVVSSAFRQDSSNAKPPLRGYSSDPTSHVIHRGSHFGVDATAGPADPALQTPPETNLKPSTLSKHHAHPYKDPTTLHHRRTPHAISRNSMAPLACEKLTDFTLDVYSQQWVRIMSEEFREHELAFRFRQSVDKVSSPFASVRREGLYEALEILIDFTAQTSTRLARAPHEGMPVETTPQTESGKRSTNANPQHSNPNRFPSSERRAGGAVQIQPFDAIRFSNLTPSAVAGKDREGKGRSQGSPSHPSQGEDGEGAELWTHVQRALSTLNLTSALFHRILLPRTEVRARVGLRELVEVVLSEEEALRWTSIGNSAHGGSGSSSSSAITALLTEVSFEEQELALRLCQGMCLFLHYQRRCIAEGCLMHYAAEIFQCFLQHVEGIFQKQRRRLLRRHQAREEEEERGARYFLPEEATVPRTPGVFVEVNPAQVRVLIALIDAVEAACHYNPPALMRLVQTGCVKALLNLVYSPCVPVEIRASVLDTISVLLKEVAPFRIAVAVREGQRNDGSSASPPAFNQPQQTPASTSAAAVMPTEREKSLLSVMIEQGASGEPGRALFDNYMGNALSHNQSGGHLNDTRQPSSSYYMDRATASRFDSAVREWFSHHGLSHTISGVMELRDFQAMTEAPRIEHDRTQRRAKQIQESKLMRLLQMIDGKRAEEREG
ncbi:unnamed protein product [Phytomonas sp. EM1]|nr:unnamed protein product [Phytomonas sp. EM1]|eukprot:CCW62187.1 unnamed protein product [Phytomonas sp. isolate EM1]